jgi:hypothetical protein
MGLMRRLIDITIIISLFALLGFLFYFVWINYSFEAVEFKKYSANISPDIPAKSVQFYPNMRFPSKEIGYFIDNSCSNEKRNDALGAFDILSRRTVLEFYPSSSGDILILCSNLAPDPTTKGHFVAGEGGPTEIINASAYSVILRAKVALYRSDTCESPQIALHEILHSLGFDHNNNTESILFPVTSCSQIIDNYIIEDIERIYAVEPAPDLVIESLSGTKKGKLVSFNVTVSNIGLKSASNVGVQIYADGENVKRFDLKNLPIGARKFLSVSNLAVPLGAEKIEFEVSGAEMEINGDNNVVELSLED